MIEIKKSKKIIFISSLFFLILYLPIFFMAYFPFWYDLNFLFQDTYEILEFEKTNELKWNLISYFWHLEDLNLSWSEKEKRHYEDVRFIFDFFTLILFFSLILIIKFYDSNYLKNKTLNNFIFFWIFLIFLLPFFSYIFDNIFHPILFYDNTDWQMNSNEVSYHLFSISNYSFFLNSFIFLIIYNILVFFAIKFSLKRNFCG